LSNQFLENSNPKKEKTLKPGDFLQTLERGFEVIKSFKASPILTISESSKITGLPRPVTRRVLLTLESLGYAKEKDGKYSLTAKILSLGYSFVSSQKMLETANPYLERFSDKVGESCSIAILDDSEIVYVARVPVKKIIKFSLGIGTRLPAYATSMGKVLLAYLPENKIEQYVADVELTKLASNTITDPENFKKELEHIRKNGWALSENELEEGLISISAPLKDIRGEVIAAINCATHTGRASRSQIVHEYLPLLLETAEQISKSIDYEVIS
jgi:IclR family pca regulon transcriptional regulator